MTTQTEHRLTDGGMPPGPRAQGARRSRPGVPPPG